MFLYAGTISQTQTFADYYAEARTQEFPIDLYGPIKGSEAERGAFLEKLTSRVRYLGHLDAQNLSRVRRRYRARCLTALSLF